MLKRELSRIDSFVNEKSVLVDVSWETYDNKSTLWKAISFFKQEADALLTESDVMQWYYYSKKNWLVYLNHNYISGENSFDYIFARNKVINEYRELIFKSISLWKFKKDSLWYAITHDYLKVWFISKDELINEFQIYFNREVLAIFYKIISAITSLGEYEDDNILSLYHNIETDLHDYEKGILAYWMKHNLLPKHDFNLIVDTLNFQWSNLESFYWLYYKEDFFEKFINYELGI